MSNKTAKTGDNVSIHYVATFDDGEQFDSSYDRNQAIDIVLGQGTLLPGFESAIEGMEEGSKKEVHLEASEAYGQVDPNAMAELPKSTFPEDFVAEIEVGTVLPLSTKEHPGRAFPATATEVKEDTIVFDLNHPLAGKNVNFDIALISVNVPEGTEATDE